MITRTWDLKKFLFVNMTLMEINFLFLFLYMGLIFNIPMFVYFAILSALTTGFSILLLKEGEIIHAP